jgi:putative ABC transport system substrate-binding protein
MAACSARSTGGRLPSVGFLVLGGVAAYAQWIAAFKQRMSELGWSEGRNTVAINVRWAEGDSDRFAEIAAEFVRLKVDVIVTASSEVTRAVKRATSTIPIVFATAGDPVGAGLVASLARPNGNVTGISNELWGKSSAPIPASCRPCR